MFWTAKNDLLSSLFIVQNGFNRACTNAFYRKACMNRCAGLFDALRSVGQNPAVLLRSQTQLTWRLVIGIKPLVVLLSPTYFLTLRYYRIFACRLHLLH